jgi:hypothetical protein
MNEMNWMDESCGWQSKRDAEIERLRALLTRVLVAEGRCPTSLMQDIRAALTGKEN